MADSKKREERRRKRRKGGAAGRPANYSHLYKDDHTTGGAAELGAEGREEAKGESAGASVSSRPSRKGSDSIDWQGEYRHVLGDLRNVLIVSVIIFAAMIGVGVFL